MKQEGLTFQGNSAHYSVGMMKVNPFKKKKKIQKDTCVDIMTFSNKVPGYLCSKRSCNVHCFVNVWGVGKNYPLLEIANMTFLVSYPVAILNKGTSDLMQG